MTGITPTAANFRAEMARHKLSREDIQRETGMNLNLLSMYVNGVRYLPYWAAHNIGLAINRATGREVFRVRSDLGVLPPRWKLSRSTAKI